MKVVLIGPTHPFRGGIAHYTTVLNQKLQDAGHDVLLVSFRRQYPSWLFPGKTDRDPSTQILAASNVRYLIDSLNPLSWINTFLEIRAYRPQLVVFQWWHEFWFPVWLVLEWLLRWGCQAKIAVICHNVLPHEHRIWSKMLARLVFRQADQVVVQSTSEKMRLLQIAPVGHVEIIPHPLYDMLEQHPITREEARQRLGIRHTIPVLLFFGFVREYKGLHVLIEALPAVRAQFSEVRLLVVGEFWEDRRNYERQIRALDLEQNVQLVDRYVPNEEVALYFKAADVVVLPYVAATQSGVLQLALGFSTPVIVSRVGGIPEAVTEEDDIILVEPGDARALSEAIMARLRTSVPRTGAGVSRANSERRWKSLVDVLIYDSRRISSSQRS